MIELKQSRSVAENNTYKNKQITTEESCRIQLLELQHSVGTSLREERLRMPGHHRILSDESCPFSQLRK